MRARPRPWTRSRTSAASTQYTVTVAATVADTTGNQLGTADTWSFTTSAPLSYLVDTTVADFGAGTTGASTYVSETGNGEVILAPTVGAEFSGSSLPSGWIANPWAGGGGAVVAGGSVTVDEAAIWTDTFYPPGRSLEFVANFSDLNQHIGFGTDFNSADWAIFSTKQTGDQLYARSTGGIETALGSSYLDGLHRYRIEWTASSARYLIDGTQVAVHTGVAFSANLRPAASDSANGSGSLAIDWMRMSPYPAGGTFTSRVLDAGGAVDWRALDGTATTPAGTGIVFEVQTGDTPTPDGTWSGFAPVANGADIPGTSRYIQYRATLTTGDTGVTPTLEQVALGYVAPVDETSPTVTGRLPSPDAMGVAVGSNAGVTFSEAVDPATVTASSVRLRAQGAGADVPATAIVLGAMVTLDPTSDLDPYTSYTVTVTTAVTDLAGNPLAATESWSFATGGLTAGFVDTTVADFGAGATGTDTYVSSTGDGEVILTPTVGAEFAGTSLPSGWESGQWTGGAASVGGGSFTVDGAWARTTATFAPGRALEFVATFSGASFQNAGLGQVLESGSESWAMFGMDGTADLLRVRVNNAGATSQVDLGSTYLNGPHRYRIEWDATQIRFLVDGTLVHTANVTIGANLRPIASDYTNGGGALVVDWMRIGPYASSGTFESRLFDAGSTTDWTTLTATTSVPSGTTATFETRTGDSTNPSDPSWSAWVPVSGDTVGSPGARYIQYRAILTTSDPAITPSVERVELTSVTLPPNRAPVFGQDLADRTDPEGFVVAGLDAGATDADGNTLTYTATGLPAGLTIDSGTGLISGTIAFDAASLTPYAVVVSVSDGVAADVTDSFEWTVENTNRAPVFGQDLADRTDPEGFVVAGLDAGATDADGNTLTYTATGLPAGLTIDSGTGLISGTIAFDAASLTPYAVVVSVSDGVAADVTDSFEWTVENTNRAPVFGQDLADRTDPEGFVVAGLDAGATDADGNTLTYTATGLPAGLTIDSGTGLISGTIAFDAASLTPYAVVVSVSDGVAADVTDSFEWTVENTNRAPVFGQDLADRTDPEGFVVAGLDAGATDADGNTLTYTATGLPAGLTIDSGTGLISGTIAFDAASLTPYAVVVSVSDGVAADVTDSFEWTVENTNRAPVFGQDLADRTDPEGFVVAGLDAGATDADGNTLTYTATGLPAGLTIDSGTGLISGTIAFDAASLTPYAVVVSVSDGVAADVTDSFEWTVENTNRAPVFGQDLADRTDPEGFVVAGLDAGATDADGNTLTYTATGLPAGLTIDSGTGLISGTIAFDAASLTPYAVVVSVSDGVAADVTDSFEWTVENTNRAPVFGQDLADRTDPEGFVVAGLDAGATDADGNTLTYTATGLPAGLTIDSGTGLISGTIAFDAASLTPYAVVVSVSDGVAADVTDSFEWTVENTNRAPVFGQDLADRTDPEGFVVAGLDAGATDADGNTLTYTATGLPAGLTIDSGTGLISGTIAFDAASLTPYAVVVSVSDGVAADVTDSFEWTVENTNRAPVFGQDLADRTDPEGFVVAGLDAGATDADGNTLTYTATGLPAGLTIDSGTGLISGTIAFDAASLTPYAVVVSVSDGVAADVTDSFEWTVENTNRAPVFGQDLADRTDPEGFVVAGLDAGATDADGNTLTYTATGLPAGLTIDSGTGLISGTIAFDAASLTPYAVVVSVSDGVAADVTDSFEWTVENTNRAPVFGQDLADRTDPEGFVVAGLDAGATDADGNTLTYTATGLPAGLTIDSGTGLISGTIAFDAASLTPYAVVVSVSDGVAADVTDSFEWTVENTNRAPVFGQDLADRTDPEGFVVAGLDAGATDADGNTLTYTATGLPAGLTIDSGTGLISGTIAFDAASLTPYAVVVSVSDGVAADVTDSFEWTVENTNRAPVFGQDLADRTDPEGFVVAGLDAGATDADGNTLTYTATGLPAGLTIDSGTGLISGTIAFDAASLTPYAVVVSVSDGVAADVTDSFEWTVENTNRAPVFGQDLADRTDPEGFVVAGLDAGATDADGNTLTYTATGLPAGLTIDSGTGLISGTIAFDAASLTPYAVVVSVSDGVAADVTDSFEWTVENTNRAPVFGQDLADRTDPEGFVVAGLDAGATDADGNTLTYTATGLPAGLTIDSGTGLISGTIAFDAASLTPYAVVVSVSDGVAADVTDSFEWTVENTNRAPVFGQDLADRTDPEGFVVAGLDAGATDADGNTLTYTATGLPAGLTIDSGTGLISGTIAFDAASLTPYAVVVSVSDGVAADVTDSFEWTVENTNRAPVFGQDLADRTDPEGFVVAGLDAGATDADGNTLTYTATGLPAGLTIDSGTGLISGTIAFDAASLTPYAVVVSVSDGVAADVTDSFEWTVENTNRAPVFGQDLADRTDPEGFVVAGLDAGATDADGNTLTYTATGLPAGLTIDSGTGLISGTIAFDAASLTPYAVVVSVSDGVAADVTDSFEWTVENTNRAPVFGQDLADRTDPEGFVVAGLDAGATDADGNTLTYTATGLPAGLTIDSGTGLISGTIAFDAASLTPYAVVVSVSDGVAADVTDSFEWTVENTNRAPVFGQDLADRTDPEGFVVAGLDAGATDADGNTLTYTATGLPAGLTIDSGTGLISGTIAFDAASLTPYAVVVSVSDGVAADVTDSFEWTVENTNRAPVFGQDLADRTDPEGFVVAGLDAGATDADGNTLTYTATGLPAGLTIDSGTGLISGTIAFDAASLTPYAVVVSVSDGVAADVTDSFEWTVENTNTSGPTVILSSTAPDPTKLATIPVSVTFSDAVTGFTAADLVVGNASVSGFTGSGTSYAFVLTAIADGAVTVAVQADAAQNGTGLGNEASETLSRTVDRVAPTITLTTPTNSSTIGDTTPNFSGIAGSAAGDVANVTVRVYAGSAVSGTALQMLTATANGSGAYSIDATAMPLGTYTAQSSQPDAAGNTGLSPATTFAITDLTPPAAPLDLAIVPLSTGLRLDWADNSEGDLAGYNVYRAATPGGELTKLNDAVITESAYLDAAAPTNSTSYYEVRAVDVDLHESAGTTESARRPSIVFRSMSTDQNGGGWSLTIPRPAGVSAGDVLVAAVSLGGHPAVTAPSGWTLVLDHENGHGYSQIVYVRVASGSEPASFRWRFSRSTTAAGSITVYAGVNAAQPIDVAGGRTNSSSQSITAPSVTTTIPEALLVGFFGIDSNAAIWPPSGMVEQAEVRATGHDKVTLESADEFILTAGATGKRVATSNKRADNIGQVIALRPIDTDPPTKPTNVVASVVSATRIDLTWTASSDNVGVAHYDIYRDGLAIGSSDEARFTDTTASPMTSYSYTVVAVDASGNESPPSDPSNTVTTPDVPPPSPPVAVNDSYYATRNKKLTIAAPGVLANDTDVNGDPLTAVLVTNVSRGTLALNATGSFTYTPAWNFTGMVTFTYKAWDGTAFSNVATVTIRVRH